MRGHRSYYPDYVRTMTRFNPGSLQREAGIPASVVHALRRGDTPAENISPSILSKFQAVYNTYWESRLDKADIMPDNWQLLIKSETPSGLRDIAKEGDTMRAWDRKLERGGVNPDEREDLTRAYDPKGWDRAIEANKKAAEKIVEYRRERDKRRPGYKDTWHSVQQVLNQMAADTSRISSDWIFYSKKV